jgi:hypothetical protein
MYFQLLKKRSWVIVFCFALLQIITPFIHTHLGGEHVDESASLHIHADEHQHSSDYTDSYIAQDTSQSMHTISVAGGIANDQDNHSVMYACMVILFCLFVSQLTVRRSYQDFNSLLDYSLKRRRPAPRAPPQF